MTILRGLRIGKERVEAPFFCAEKEVFLLPGNSPGGTGREKVLGRILPQDAEETTGAAAGAVRVRRRRMERTA